MQPQLKSPVPGASRHAAPQLRGDAIATNIVLAILFILAPSLAQGDRPGATPHPGLAAPPAVSPAEPSCDNQTLTAYRGLLVLAPHPDDETLAFAGLIMAYMRQGKPVQVVVVTDGDAYCEACRFWKSTSVHGPTCSALDLSNFATAAVDSFAEVRRGESAAAAAILGRRPPTFLGYPDTGLGAAWLNSRRGELQKKLRRSDFSGCTDCESCQNGYGGGPETDLTASSLVASLSSLLAATSENTLVATTHWLDGHGDHAALGNFVKTLNDALAVPRPVVYAVIHAHTPKSTSHGDCWYPGPQALVCPCADEERATTDPTWIADLRRHRMQPGLPAAIPDDAPYGTARQLCLPEELYRGETATKVAAIRAYRSQLGTLARTGSVPSYLDAIIDCNGYLISFARRTEAFVLTEPAAATPSSCDPGGVWEGSGGASAQGSDVGKATLSLARTGERTLAGSLSLTDAKGAQRQEIVVGDFDARCTLTLRPPQRPYIVYRGSVSRDGRSLYGSWGAEAPGFFVVHR
jgi:LmbE family N-acetylglucosaminyl deacetylase